MMLVALLPQKSLRAPCKTGKSNRSRNKVVWQGSVQDLNTSLDGSQIKLTIAKWFTPNIAVSMSMALNRHKVDLTERLQQRP